MTRTSNDQKSNLDRHRLNILERIFLVACLLVTVQKVGHRVRVDDSTSGVVTGPARLNFPTRSRCTHQAVFISCRYSLDGCFLIHSGFFTLCDNHHVRPPDDSHHGQSEQSRVDRVCHCSDTSVRTNTAPGTGIAAELGHSRYIPAP